MAGRGGTSVSRPLQWDGVVPPECESHPSIIRLSTDMIWESAREPLHSDIDSLKACEVDPEMSFGNVMREKLRSECVGVGLVPCAVGGTTIKKWVNGEHLYENMVKRSKESVKSSSKGEIKTSVWYQRESDALSLEVAEAYKEKMKMLIHNVREDLGLPLLPIIQVAIASGDGFMEKVREAQMGINMLNVVCW